MIGAGTIISPLIKVVTTVAILAAVYLFIVKPTLDTTKSISENVSNSINGGPSGVSPDVRKSIRQAQRLQQQAAQASQVQLRNANRLIACINRADGSSERIAACNRRHSP